MFGYKIDRGIKQENNFKFLYLYKNRKNCVLTFLFLSSVLTVIKC